jgi:DNA-binding transcriptional LysR family regulator
VEFRHLITFKTIVERGGFKKAAEHLGYAQSSITTHIKELEDELKKPLFDRLGKKVVLTHSGQQFLPYATKLIELSFQAKEILNTDDEPAGDLTIGASESLTVCRIPSILLDYKRNTLKLIFLLNLRAAITLQIGLNNCFIKALLWPCFELVVFQYVNFFGN